MRAPGSCEEFALNKYLSLETFRRNGIGVRTPVWFAEEITNSHTTVPVRLYAYFGSSGKVKRITIRALGLRRATCAATSQEAGLRHGLKSSRVSRQIKECVY